MATEGIPDAALTTLLILSVKATRTTRIRRDTSRISSLRVAKQNSSIHGFEFQMTVTTK